MAADYDSDIMESDEALEAYQEYEAYDTEVDDMLDALMDETEQDLAERRRRRRQQQQQRRGVRTATGRTPYQAPVESGYVTQKQFKEAMGRVGEETRRNAEGIKTVNTRLGTLDGRVSDVVTVSKSQSRKIGALNTRMKLDGALDFASSFTLNTTGDAVNLDLSQVLRGALKNGALGDGKGALSNPLVVGGIGFVLRNPGIISGLLTPRP